MLIEILSRIANVVKSPRLDSYIEEMEQKAVQKARDKRIAKTLSQAKSITICLK